MAPCMRPFSRGCRRYAVAIGASCTPPTRPARTALAVRRRHPVCATDGEECASSRCLPGSYILQELFRPPLTLTHGDAHIENVFFHSRFSGGAMFIDFGNMMFSQGMYDVAFYMVNSMEVVDRRALEKQVRARTRSFGARPLPQWPHASIVCPIPLRHAWTDHVPRSRARGVLPPGAPSLAPPTVCAPV